MTNEYYDGIREGLSRYAWMKDGVYYVGTCGTTLKKAYSDVERERDVDTSAPVEQGEACAYHTAQGLPNRCPRSISIIAACTDKPCRIVRGNG